MERGSHITNWERDDAWAPDARRVPRRADDLAAMGGRTMASLIAARAGRPPARIVGYRRRGAVRRRRRRAPASSADVRGGAR